MERMPTLLQHDLLLTYILFAKTLLLNKVAFPGTRGEGFIVSFFLSFFLSWGRTQFNPKQTLSRWGGQDSVCPLAGLPRPPVPVPLPVSVEPLLAPLSEVLPEAGSWRGSHRHTPLLLWLPALQDQLGLQK